MSLIELPANRTVLSADTAAKYLASAYKAVAGKAATKAIMKLLIGQWAGETGNGNSMYNYNFGNTMPTGNDTHFHYLNASEIIDGKEVKMRSKFAAYASPKEGAEAFIKVLKSRKHWWDGLQSGTVEGFIKGLTTAPKYFTAFPDVYTNLLVSRIEAYGDIAVKYAGSIWGTIIQVVFGMGIAGSGLYYYGKKHGIKSS